MRALIPADRLARIAVSIIVRARRGAATTAIGHANLTILVRLAP
jgi:hypothetical protein